MWVMAYNEALRERGPFVPWQPLALVLVTIEAVLHALVWNRVAAVDWLAASWLLPVVVLAIVANRRYSGLVARTVPADITDAVSVGWGFFAVRLGLAVGLVYVVAVLLGEV